MSPVFDFHVEGTPVPQGSLTPMISRGTGRIIVINKDVRLATWRNSIVAAAIEAQAEQSQTRGLTFPFPGGIAIDVEFRLARPNHHYGTGKNADRLKPSSPAYPARMPDIDKLLRAVLDALTVAQVWHDDGQVVTVIGRKRYGDLPGVMVSVAPLDT